MWEILESGFSDLKAKFEQENLWVYKNFAKRVEKRKEKLMKNRFQTTHSAFSLMLILRSVQSTKSIVVFESETDFFVVTFYFCCCDLRRYNKRLADFIVHLPSPTGGRGGYD